MPPLAFPFMHGPEMGGGAPGKVSMFLFRVQGILIARVRQEAPPSPPPYLLGWARWVGLGDLLTQIRAAGETHVISDQTMRCCDGGEGEVSETGVLSLVQSHDY